MTYTTLTELHDAFLHGALDPSKVTVVIDNDATYAYTEDGEQEIYSGGGPMEIFGEALDLLGIRHEPA